MIILITGANGQLARAFQKSLEGSHYRVKALNRTQMDIADMHAVARAMSTHEPDMVINCAAYNFVDKAEQDSGDAFRVNAEGVRNLASECKKRGIFLVHYSTDYVFDGMKDGLYSEEDKPNPVNKYGMSKLSGEQYLLEETDNFLLFRVSWVFGDGTQNFLYKLNEWAKTARVLKIVCDQVSVPTYTADIVNMTMFAIGKGLKGLYHLTNSGYASRYEMARYFMERMGINNLILPVPTAYFPSPARRPYISVMSNKKLSDELDVSIPDWKIGIDRYVQQTFEREEI
jgi:dTDP-4-dehydrorhamnose reductase